VLPDEVQTPIFGYLAALERELPGVVSGVYVVGSVALGDFQSQASNLDVVVTSGVPWTTEALGTARRVGKVLDRTRPACVAYLTTAQLAVDPRTVDAPCIEGDRAVRSDRLVNPLTWQILDSGALDLRGPDHVDVWDDPDGRQSWANQHLRDQWAAAIDDQHRPGALWLRRRVSTEVMDMVRLAMVALNGAVMSKLAASRAVADLVPGRFHRILEDSAGYRLGGRASMYWGPVERKRDALDLMGELLAASTGADAAVS